MRSGIPQLPDNIQAAFQIKADKANGARKVNQLSKAVRARPIALVDIAEVSPDGIEVQTDVVAKPVLRQGPGHDYERTVAFIAEAGGEGRRV